MEKKKTVFDKLLGGCRPEISAFLGEGNIRPKENPFTFDDSYTLEESLGEHPNMYPKFSLSPQFCTQDFDNTSDSFAMSLVFWMYLLSHGELRVTFHVIQFFVKNFLCRHIPPKYTVQI